MDRRDEPLHWRKPRLVFVNSMSDLFHEAVPDDFIDAVFGVMAYASQHTFQVLTKRPARMADYLKTDRRFQWANAAVRQFGGVDPDAVHDAVNYGKRELPNVWLGVSIEDQATADERIPLLFATPAAVRWVSAEPLLGPVSMRWLAAFSENAPTTTQHPRGRTNHLDGLRRLNWLVLGGESGPKARPMHPQWARDLRDQCAAADMPFLFKQWGEWAPTVVEAGGDLGGDLRKGVVQHLHAPGNPEGYFRRGDAYVRRVGKKAAGRLLDGVLHDGYPESQGNR